LDIYEKSYALLDRITLAEQSFQTLEKEYGNVEILRLEWMMKRHELYPRAEKPVSAIGELNVLFDRLSMEEDKQTRLTLRTLLKKPLITLGLTAKEQW
jgi:hypothetical protein